MEKKAFNNTAVDCGAFINKAVCLIRLQFDHASFGPCLVSNSDPNRN